ncbi:MAG TPA: FHA domain-containing protein [Pseudonocardiaceae bacterium]|nr:FHA domain-containing protein [Pseudonocardiaceae bacterium]
MNLPDEHRRPDLETELQTTRTMLTPVGGAPIGGSEQHAEEGAVAVAAPLLRIARGPQTGLAFNLRPGITTVGRGDDSDIVLDDSTVSRRHAVLQRNGDHVVLRDAESLNGTYLNRQPIAQEVALVDGDEIWTGKYRLLFRTH